MADRRGVRSLADYRTERQRSVAQTERLPLELGFRPEAVSLVLGDEFELWLTPAEAEGLGRDLLRLARAARGNHGR